MISWMKKLPFFLFPPTCLLCGAPGQVERDLCIGCEADLPRNTNPCRRCAQPLDNTITAGLVCGRCLSESPPFQDSFVPFLYQYPMDYLVQGLKFHGRLTHARLLCELLAAALVQRETALPECIIPVPLHPGRLRERGFNQALELARPIARRLGVPLVSKGIQRIRQTPPQSSLDLKARRSNVRGAFRVSRALAAQRVAIIDDVVTSGNTVTEFAHVLGEAGAESIEIWAVARTP